MENTLMNDASWLLYPFHLLVNLIKSFVYGFLLIIAIALAIAVWVFTAHDNRADVTKNFASEQMVYRINPATNAVTAVKAGYLVQAEDFAASFNGCSGTGSQLKNT